MSLREKIAARKAEMNQPAPVQPEVTLKDKIAKRKAELNAPPPPVDYDSEKDIYDLKVPYTGVGDAVKLLGGLALDSRPESQINILKEYVPGVESDFDDEGNPFVTYEGNKYYINKPGVSGSDFSTLIAEIAKFLPASKVASMGASALARFGIGAAAYGTTSAASDLGANALGSKQGIDPIKAGVSAVFGGAAEAVTPFIMQGVKRLFSSSKLYHAGKGLTERGKEFVKELGFDPAVFNEAAAKEFSRMIDGSVDPKVAAAVAENKRWGIRTSKGEATQDFGLIQKEDLARKGGFGDRAQKDMQRFDEAKTTEMLEAKDVMQSDLAGGAPSVTREVDGAGIVTEGIKNRSNAQKSAINQAYEQAAEYDARLSVESLGELSKRVGERFKEGTTFVDKEMTPATIRAIKEIKSIAKGKNITAVSLKRLEATRRKLGAMADAAKNPTDKRNVLVVKYELDSWLDDAFDKALFEGDEQALSVLKEARSARKRYSDLYTKQGNDVAGAEIEKIIKFDADENQALSYLFGKGRLGGKDNATKVAVRVREILGPNSPEWAAFKETAFTRLFKNVVKENNGKKSFNGQAFVNNFDTAMKDNPKLMKEIFGNDLPKLSSLRSAINRATHRPEGTVNHPGTAVAISKIAQEAFQKFALAMGLSGDVTSYILINSASKATKGAGRTYSKGVKPALPQSSFASALMAAGGVEGHRSLSPQPSANNRNERGNR